MPHRVSPLTSERSGVGIRRAIRDHHAMVYRVAYGVVGNAADAEDVVQATFLTLVRRHSSIRDDAALPAWLARVAVNEARQWMRGESRRRGRETAVARARQEWVGAGEERAMNRDEVRDAVEHLPEDLRTPLLLHYVEGLQYREIAEVLACSEGAVAKRLHSGRKQLERRLAPLGAVAPLPRLLGEAAPAVPVGLEERVVLAVEGATVVGAVSVASSTKFVWSAVSAVVLVALTTLWTVQADPITHAGPPAVEDPPVVAAKEENEPKAPSVADTPPDKIGELVDRFLRRPGGSATGFARVSGRVVDVEGVPMAGVPVTLELVRDSAVSRRTQRTDAEGRYEFPEIDVSVATEALAGGDGRTPEAIAEQASTNWARHKPPFLGQTMVFTGTRATVRVELDGYRSVEDGAYHLSGGTEVVRTHVLRLAARIAGRVVDGEGAPVAGAEVIVRGGTSVDDRSFAELFSADRRAVSDAEGRFVLPRLGEARYLLEASASGFGSAVALADANGEDVTFTLAPCARVEVLVEHRSEKRPIANARVGLFRGGRSFAQEVTGPDGVARFEVGAGDYRIAVFRNDFPVAIEPVTAAAGETSERRMRVDDGIALTIQMSETPRQVGSHLQAVLRPAWPAGTHPDGVGVQPTSYSLTWGPHQAVRYVDRSGSVRFEGLIPGRYVFEVRGVEKGRRSFDLVTEIIEVGPAPRETVRRVDFTEVERGRLSVTALGSNGEPEGFPLVRAERVGGVGSVAAQLGKDGRCSVTVMPGEYRVFVTRPGAPIQDLGVVDVRPGEVREFEVTFDPVIAAETVFDVDRRLWLAGDLSYASLLLLLGDLAVVPTSVDPSFEIEGRRVTWPSDVTTEEFLNYHVRYLGLSWEVRSGKLVWVGR